MRISVMGAGGLGGYLGARLAATGQDVAFIARGAHLTAIQQNGLRLKSPLGDLPLPDAFATSVPTEVGPVDLVLFTVKLWDSEQAAAALPPLVAAHTRVLTLQNGIDSADFIARFMPREQVLSGITYVPAYVAEPGVIGSPGGSKRVVIERDGGNPVIESFRVACDRAAGIELEVTDDISPLLWEKFVRFAAFSAATSLMRSSAGPIIANPESRAFLRQLVEDGMAVAAASGNALSDRFADETMAFYATFPNTQRSSMAEDLDRGRRLELAWISGRIHGLGLQHGVATPAHTAAYRALVLHAHQISSNVAPQGE